MSVMQSMLIISPHLDDAVLGCGRWLFAHPGSTVVTVFAGSPRDGERLTEWDARCGFTSGIEAIAVRRQEDCAALGQLHATPVWLDFRDSQYEETSSVDAICDALRRLMREIRPSLTLFPLGLYHSDHLLVHEASRKSLAREHVALSAAYEDAPYRGMRGVLQQRLMALAEQGVRATPAQMDGVEVDPQLKQRAISAYASQLRALGSGAMADARHPERFWLLEDSGDVC